MSHNQPVTSPSVEPALVSQPFQLFLKKAIAAFIVLPSLFVVNMVAADGDWNPAEIDAQTRREVAITQQHFYACVQAELATFDQPGLDFRHATNLLVLQCENKLAPVRERFEKQGVPGTFINNFLQRTRMNAGKKILPILMQKQL